MSETTMNAQQEADAMSDAFSQLVSNDGVSDEVKANDDDLPSPEINDEGSVEQQTEAPAEPSIEEKLAALEAERDNWRHKYQSDAGRVSAYQRQINEYQARLQQLEQAVQQSQQPSANPQGSGMADEEWARFQEAYPEIAKALEVKLAGVNQVNHVAQQALTRLQQVENVVAPLQEREAQAAEAAKLAVLDKQHPDWRTKVATPQFKQWISQQPQAVQQLAYSDAVDDAAFLIKSFERESGLSSSQAQGQSRSNRLQQNLGVKGRGSQGRTGVPQDFEGAFAYFASQS